MQPSTKKAITGSTILASIIGGIFGGSSWVRQERAERAFQDSFPKINVRFTIPRRDSIGTVLPVGKHYHACLFAYNRYTKDPRIIFHASVPEQDAIRVANACEKARASYEAERSG